MPTDQATGASKNGSGIIHQKDSNVMIFFSVRKKLNILANKADSIAKDDV